MSSPSRNDEASTGGQHSVYPPTAGGSTKKAVSLAEPVDKQTEVPVRSTQSQERTIDGAHGDNKSTSNALSDATMPDQDPPDSEYGKSPEGQGPESDNDECSDDGLTQAEREQNAYLVDCLSKGMRPRGIPMISRKPGGKKVKGPKGAQSTSSVGGGGAASELPRDSGVPSRQGLSVQSDT
jgi:hypothetical protein